MIIWSVCEAVKTVLKYDVLKLHIGVEMPIYRVVRCPYYLVSDLPKENISKISYERDHCSKLICCRRGVLLSKYSNFPNSAFQMVFKMRYVRACEIFTHVLYTDFYLVYIYIYINIYLPIELRCSSTHYILTSGQLLNHCFMQSHDWFISINHLSCTRDLLHNCFENETLHQIR